MAGKYGAGRSAATITRRGRGKAAKSLKLIEASIEILREIQPASIRAVSYRLFVAGLIRNMSKGSTDAVSKQLVWAREQGLLPWGWVVDETREAERISTWNRPDDIIDAAVRGYRKDYWRDQSVIVEVWSEKGTVRGTLAPVLDRYGVTFRVMHGYGSATALHGIAQETLQSEKPLIVIYVGDWDCSGMHMSVVDIPARLERYGGSVTFVRGALDERDVGPQTELPWFDASTKAGDPRHRWFVDNYGHRCWELDALSPVDMRSRIETMITAVIDQDAWDHTVAVERAEIESMQMFFAHWPSFSGQPSK